MSLLALEVTGVGHDRKTQICANCMSETDKKTDTQASNTYIERPKNLDLSSCVATKSRKLD